MLSLKNPPWTLTPFTSKPKFRYSLTAAQKQGEGSREIKKTIKRHNVGDLGTDMQQHDSEERHEHKDQASLMTKNEEDDKMLTHVNSAENAENLVKRCNMRKI